ncbi:hypothetical protein [Pseudoruegeria sp. SK021]|uniref:hypothetical protein n=1 Tax=Pseudoruegeria sp. SK021 TaxID=1933035 RepID=UPI000A219C2E|nr:hypothetical protein [Pseudoruegeria sp. SK021]OSP55411.1 hypothetical protein BV911_07100 [Pseudoruegeria sp. SK021]
MEVNETGLGFEMTSDGSDLVSFTPYEIVPASASSSDKPAYLSPEAAGNGNPILGFTSFIFSTNFGESLLASNTYLGVLVNLLPDEPYQTVSILFKNIPTTGAVVGLPGYEAYTIMTFVTYNGTSLVGAVTSGEILSVVVNGAVTAVPIPASGLILFSAFGCLASLRLKSSRRKASQV